MFTFTPVVSAGYAVALGLVSVALTTRVILARVRSGIHTGDGGHAPLAQPHARWARRRPARPARAPLAW